MINSRGIGLLSFVLALLWSLPLPSSAEDIDIFTGSSGGAAAAPKVMILIDNANNWVSDQPNGKSKLLALSAALNSISTPMSVGLATFSYNSPAGAYVRFAPRDISIAANRTALQNLINVISADANATRETGNNKDEAASLYEMYKYFSSLKPRSGSLAQNYVADASGNVPASYPGSTAAAQGLTSNFAFKADGTYDSVATLCSRNYVVYIAANNSAPSSPSGAQIYEGVNAGRSLLPAPSTAKNWGVEWARYLYANQNPQIVTYVMDAYYPDDNQDASYADNLRAMGKLGGGGYAHVRNQAEIQLELLRIFAEIKAVNSTFALATLPVSATNRSQSKNQVFVPVFRPDPDAKPRWMGNLKEFQLIASGPDVVLGDFANPPQPAINPLNGSPTVCSISNWTTDSGAYWQNVPLNPSAASECASSPNGPFSDAPDGPTVEKGGSAEVIRKGNNPPITNGSPTWAVNRTLYTEKSGSLVTFDSTSSGLAPTLTAFIRGQDVNDENNNANVTETRPSLHSDVIHSRPQPLDYGGTTGVVVYYGANDGTLRAVDATSGKERWAFIAPEFFPKFARLMSNTPLINYSSVPTSVIPTPSPKDYFFDGSIGAYQAADGSKAWIFPTMRRGGRMLYGLDVSDPATPQYKWKAGCPNPGDDRNCTVGMSGIGQTWSQPNVAPAISGYAGPVIVVGGGYDGCEDMNSSTPWCSSPKGATVYVIDANTGAVIKSFSTMRSVAADVALVSITSPGVADHAYAVDTGGNVYRIDFGATVENWTMTRVAYTNGSGRKFLYAPALLPATGGKVYLALGTGDREHPLYTQYPYLGVTNRFYVFKDDLGSTTARNLDDPALMRDFTANTTCATAGLLPAATELGWYMNLNQYGAGEQVVTSAVIIGGMVAFSTNRPIPPAAGTCSTTLGEARGYFFSLFNASGSIGVPGVCGGSRSAVFFGGGLPPSPAIGRVPVNGKVRTVVIGASQRRGGANSPIGAQEVKPPITPTRKTIYWKSSGQN